MCPDERNCETMQTSYVIYANMFQLEADLLPGAAESGHSSPEPKPPVGPPPPDASLHTWEGRCMMNKGRKED